MFKSNSISFASALLAGALALVMTASCNNDDNCCKCQKMEYTKLQVRLNPQETKSTDLTATKASGSDHVAQKDSTINNLQIFVFNADGSLDSYKLYSGASLTGNYAMNVTTGHKQVWAVANSHDISEFASVKTLNELKAKTVDLSKENVKDFAMIGSAEADAVKNVDATADIKLKRFVARIFVGSVKADFSSGYSGTSLQDVKLYITNIYEHSKASNRMGSGSLVNNDTLLVNSFSGYAMSNLAYYNHSGNVGTSPVSMNQFFYCYANDNSVKKTKLIVEAKLNGITYYYPIVITDGGGAGVKPNMAYTLSNITITRPGALRPGDDIEFGSITFNISCEEWSTHTMNNVTF